MPMIRTAVLGLLSALALSLPAAAQTADVTDNPPYSIKSGDRRASTSKSSTRWPSC